MRILVFIFVAFLLSSCFDKGDCVKSNTNLVKINLKNKADNTAHPITFTSIQVEGTNIGVTYTAPQSVISLPVDPNKEETTFILNYEGVSKRITFSYRNQTIVPSSDCGALAYQFDMVVKETTYDPTMIKKINSQLLNNVSVNFEIYF